MTERDRFAVLAELPLGAYTGRDPGGGVDLMPAPARLHSALVMAAAQGPRAVADESGLHPSGEDRAALQWLEQHPPDGVLIPAHRRFDARVTAYRKIGLLLKNVPQVIGKDDHRSVAVRGPLAWTWDDPPPPAVVDCLEQLVGDVSHLGTSETPARLWVGAARPTHRRDPTADLFTTDGVDLDIAEPGRLAALERAYSATRKMTSVKDDAVKSSEEDLLPASVSSGRAPARYVELDTEPVLDGPWDTAVLCELDGPPIPVKRYVAWAVAMHRALIATIGTGAPPVLTGAYPDGQGRPANRVAIQLVSGPAAGVLGLDVDRTSVAVALPRGADPVQAAAVVAAASSLRRLSQGAGSRRVRALGIRSGARFWPAVAGEPARTWSTWPVAIPDTRPPRRQRWTLADAAALSVALVFRDEWPETGDRGDARYRRLVDAALEAGVDVVSAARVIDSRVGRWVHRGHEGVVVQPYRAELTLGGLTGSRALVAIGQSRHLGGGLLVPTDLIPAAGPVDSDAEAADVAEPEDSA